MADDFDEQPIDVLDRWGGTRVEVVVRRRRSDGAACITIISVNRSGRSFTVPIFGHEAARFGAAVDAARRVVREHARAPLAQGTASDARAPGARRPPQEG